MKTRGFAGVLAILLAALATGAVYLYVKGVRDQDHTAAQSVQVVVSTADITPGTALDPLIAQGQFELKAFPTANIVQGAVTTIDQLKGKTTSSGILAGEQVTLARLQGSDAHTGGQLGINDGYQAVTLSLDAPHAGGGYIQAGDHISIYAEGDISVLQGTSKKAQTLRQLLKPTGDTTTTTTKRDVGTWAFTVVPDVRVLRVFNSAVNATATNVDGSNAELQITLELQASDVQRVMLAREEFSMWLSLLPPGQLGETPNAVSVPLAPQGQA